MAEFFLFISQFGCLHSLSMRPGYGPHSQHWKNGECVGPSAEPFDSFFSEITKYSALSIEGLGSCTAESRSVAIRIGHTTRAKLHGSRERRDSSVLLLSSLELSDTQSPRA